MNTENTPLTANLPAHPPAQTELLPEDAGRLLTEIAAISGYSETGRGMPVLSACTSLCGPREANQDVALTQTLQVQDGQPGHLALVADGMGGEPCGEAASREAVRAALCALQLKFLEAAQGGASRDAVDWLRHAFNAANHWVRRYSGFHPACHGMGTTLSLALVLGGNLYVASVGDSRIFLCRDGMALQVTEDDSYPARLVQRGLLTRGEAENHPAGHMLTRHIGGGSGVDGLAVSVHELAPGDAALAVSDGVWQDGQHGIVQFSQALAEGTFQSKRLESAIGELVVHALERGAQDNVSAAALWLDPGNDGNGLGNARHRETPNQKEE